MFTRGGVSTEHEGEALEGAVNCSIEVFMDVVGMK